MILSLLALYDALIAIALIAAGIVAAHYGLATPFAGFQLFLIGFFIANLAVLLGLAGTIVTTVSARRRPNRGRALFGLIVGLILVLPVYRVVQTHLKYPPINDITTDTQNPPMFVHAEQLPANHGRDLAYNPKVAARQQAAPVYHDLGPLKLGAPPAVAYKQVQIIAGEIPSWQITSNDEKAMTLEGIATSALFHFKDDFIVEVRPDARDGSLVEMRSKSRDGTGDLGTNYMRIVSFFRDVQRGLHEPPPGTPQVQP